VEALAAWSGAVLHRAYEGLPMAHPGHIDVVYDSIAKPETFEVGVRVLAERGRLVYTGVAVPGRWESTPIYFKELTLVGSNAFAIEEFEGRRRHAMEHYLSLVEDGRIDLTAMVTHRFALEGWWDALRALARPEDSGVLKATFTPSADPTLIAGT
jgi:threonine dehydrogenase-like Zn-dependent dehydrogenase